MVLFEKGTLRRCGRLGVELVHQMLDRADISKTYDRINIVLNLLSTLVCSSLTRFPDDGRGRIEVKSVQRGSRLARHLILVFPSHEAGVYLMLTLHVTGPS